MGWWKSTSLRLSTGHPRPKPSRAENDDFVQHRLPDPFGDGMNGTHRRLAAAFLFAGAATICPLGVSANPSAPGGAPKQCNGDSAQILSPFTDDYSCASLGPVP